MYQRFKAFCRDHDISVGTITGLALFIGFTASGIVSQVGGYDYSGLPTWAQSAIGVGLAALVLVGRFATSFATWLGRFPDKPTTPPAADAAAELALPDALDPPVDVTP